MTPETPFDEWLRGQLVEAYGMERETWAVDQVRRVIDKINSVRNREPQFTVEVLWLREMTAFTAPGRFIYISRRLLERLPHDDAAAMVLAHEAAHHDLDHLADFAGWTRRLPRTAGSWLVARLFRTIERRVYSREHEFEADRYGLRLCRQANFDGLKCLELFDIMKQYVLDYGDEEALRGVHCYAYVVLAPHNKRRSGGRGMNVYSGVQNGVLMKCQRDRFDDEGEE